MPRRDRLDRQRAQARRGKLDRERNTVEPTTDFDHGVRIARAQFERGLHGRRTVDEQAHALVLRQLADDNRVTDARKRERRNRVDALRRNVKLLAARGENR